MHDKQHLSTSQSKHLLHPKYRPDIDGLRALAVLSVVGFHAFPGLINGGFIGVDIFFVISGFLISTIIFENLEHNNFSFLVFYSRRVKRIFPALLVVLLASFAYGWFMFLPDEFKQLGKHIAAGAGFISNFVLWGESGYFDNAADTKPLLHLWSLGIEEQFYIIWPLLLWLAWKSKANLLLITLSVAAISFLLNIWLVNTETVAAFYSPQTRFWELLIGSTLAYLALFKQSLLQSLKIGNDNSHSIVGALLLCVGFLLINQERAFPGYWALLPTLGTALIISAGSQAWLNRAVLSHPVLVWFGLISFPLYLWHWPLLSFLRIADADPSRILRISAVLISIALAWLTYKFIEKPIRFGNKKMSTTFLLAGALFLIGFVGYLTILKNGFIGYGPRSEEKVAFSQHFENSLPKRQYFEAEKIPIKYRHDCDFYDIPKYRIGKATKIPLNAIDKSCYERNPTAKKVLFLWGDSHAQHLFSGLKNNLPKNWDVLIVASSGCTPNALVKSDSKTDSCERSNWFALKKIKESKPDVVIVAHDKNHQFENLKTIGNYFKGESVAKVIFVGPTPHWKPDLPKIILKQLWSDTPVRTFVGVDQKINSDNTKLKEAFLKEKDLFFADLIDVFCNGSGCLTRIGDDKKLNITTWDYGHLTPGASDYVAKKLLSKIVTDEK